VTARFLGGFVYAVVNTWPSYTYALLALLQSLSTLLSTRGRRTRAHHLALVHVRVTCFTSKAKASSARVSTRGPRTRARCRVAKPRLLLH
jgi:hypothetical protein